MPMGPVVCESIQKETVPVGNAGEISPPEALTSWPESLPLIALTESPVIVTCKLEPPENLGAAFVLNTLRPDSTSRDWPVVGLKTPVTLKSNIRLELRDTCAVPVTRLRASVW